MDTVAKPGNLMAIDSQPPANVPDDPGYKFTIVAFDFAGKTVTALPPAGIADAIRKNNYVWIDVDYTVENTVRSALSGLDLLGEDLLDEILTAEPGTYLSRHAEHVHLVITGCSFNPVDHLEMQRIDVVIDEHVFLSIHRGPHFVIDTIRGEFRTDFERFAQTPSFLMYELWDALIENYADVEKRLGKLVASLQSDLVQAEDDTVFSHVADIGENLLHFRAILMPARTVLVELAGRKSHLISEATQSDLYNIAGTLEQVLQDVLVDREILTQSLNLHMSMVSHRTNKAMSKLTVISAIFLPLTFLCGVYGMNFIIFPELHWKFGYAFFWGTCITIVTILIVILRRLKLL